MSALRLKTDLNIVPQRDLETGLNHCFVIEANKNVFQNANGPRVQCGVRIVYKRTQITSDALQRCLIDCATKRQE